MISARYKIVTNVMEKCERITQKEECADAAADLDLYGSWAEAWDGIEEIKGSTNLIPYCWYNSKPGAAGGGLKYNTDSTASKPCGRIYSCICKE